MFKILPIGDIYPDPNQPRKTGKEDADLADFAASISSVGVIQNLHATPDGKGKYMLVAGERRYRAALKAGLLDVPVMIHEDISDSIRLEIQLAENILRKDLTMWERADAIARLLKIHPDRQEAIKRLGISNGHLTHLLELTSLAPEVQSLSDEKVTKDATTLVLVNQLAKKSPEKAQELITKAKAEGRLPRKEVVEALAPHRRPRKKKSQADEQKEAAPAAAAEVASSPAKGHSSVPSSSAPIKEAETDERPLVRCPPRAKLNKVCALLNIQDGADPATVLEQLIDRYLANAGGERLAA